MKLTHISPARRGPFSGPGPAYQFQDDGCDISLDNTTSPVCSGARSRSLSQDSELWREYDKYDWRSPENSPREGNVCESPWAESRSNAGGSVETPESSESLRSQSQSPNPESCWSQDYERDISETSAEGGHYHGCMPQYEHSTLSKPNSSASGEAVRTAIPLFVNQSQNPDPEPCWSQDYGCDIAETSLEAGHQHGCMPQCEPSAPSTPNSSATGEAVRTAIPLFANQTQNLSPESCWSPDYGCDISETSLDAGHQHGCMPQCEPSAPSTPNISATGDAVRTAMPLSANCYQQVPVAFMMVPVVACYYQNADQYYSTSTPLKLSEIIYPPEQLPVPAETLSRGSADCSHEKGSKEANRTQVVINLCETIPPPGQQLPVSVQTLPRSSAHCLRKKDKTHAKQIQAALNLRETSPPKGQPLVPVETSPRSSAPCLHKKGNKDAERMHAQSTGISAPPAPFNWYPNPKNTPEPALASQGEAPAAFTTLVIKNVPARYKQNMLLQEFEVDGSFDFFYLPYSLRESKSMGFAFINFRSHELALGFQGKWQHQFLQHHGPTKHLDVQAATIQGLAENLNRLSMERLQRSGMLPAFFDCLGNRLNSMRELQRYGILP